MIQPSSIRRVSLEPSENLPVFLSNQDLHGSELDQTHTMWPLLQALGLLGVFSTVEFSAGLWSNSLSLVSDAEHILSDTAALGIALGVNWLSRSTWRLPKQYQLEVWAALLNALSLIVIAIWIIKEAMIRLQTPELEILGLPMLATAIAGLLINSFNVFCLRGCAHQSLNLRGAFVHLLADLIGSIGAVLAAIAVIWLHWTWADGFIGFLVAAMITWLSISLLIECVNNLRGSNSTAFLTRCACLPTDLDCGDRQHAERVLLPTLEEIIQ